MTDAYRNLEAALARRREDLERQLERARADERDMREQTVDIDRQLDANRSLEGAPARRREALARQLEVTREDERAIREQIDDIDRQLGGERGPRRRKIGYAAWLSVGVALLSGVAYDHYISDLRYRERMEAFSFVSAMSDGVAAHYEETGELCPSAPAGVRLSDSEAFASRECMGLDVPTPPHHTFYYNAGGNYLGPPRGGWDPGPNAFEVAAVRDPDGHGKPSLITQTGVPGPRSGALTRSEFFVVDAGE
jgi:hypothetical protein